MPDATRAVVRGLDAEDVANCGIPALMLNSFHLAVHPGVRTVQALAGAHAFAGWSGPIFTDSGGFQVFSLIRQNKDFGTINKNGAIFRLSATDKRRNLTPEKAIQTQLQIDSDVLFCLDDCTAESDPPAEQEASVNRTIAWAARCKAEFARQIAARRLTEADRPRLFAVIQGGNDRALRERCATELRALGFDGYGLGGWPLDEDRNLLADIIEHTASLVPAGSPLHALGVGKPENVVACARFGYNLFDCAIPTRDARHYRLYVFNAKSLNDLDTLDLNSGGSGATRFYRALYINDDRYRDDAGPVSTACDCLCCRRYSRAYLHHLYDIRDTLAYRLGTIHNLRFYATLMRLLREQPSPPGE